MMSLREFAGGQVRSEAFGVSKNGTVVLVRSSSSNGLEAFRHTGSAMVGLRDLAGGPFRTEAYAANLDGSVIMGRGRAAGPREAFRWTQAGEAFRAYTP